MRKHEWARDESGDIDQWQLASGYHNGPRCTVCDETFCEHCEDPDTLECAGPKQRRAAAAGDVVRVAFTSEVTQVKDGWVRVLNGTEVHWVRVENVEVL